MAKNKVSYYAARAVRGNDDILVCAGDVETDGLGGKLLMVQWGAMGEIFVDSSPDMVANFFAYAKHFPKPAVWYFHFGQYDWRYFLDYFIESGMSIEIGMRTANDIYEFRFWNDDNEVCILRDSYALWNSPLEKLAQAFCPEIPKLEIDIENFNPEDPKHIEYAKRDVEILLKGLPRLFDMLNEHFGVNPSATTAGTSMKAWQKSLGPDEIYNASRFDDREVFIRQAYYGGLVFLTNNSVHEDVETFDINSSYPDVMCRFGVPYGRMVETRNYQTDLMGIYRVRVKAPKGLIIPILPGRDVRGNMRWFSGEFDTVCTNRELIFAVKQGYEVIEVYEGFVFEETVFPFNTHIEKCKTIRKEFKGRAEELLAKLMQNSLYGKFGARRDRLKMMAAHSMDDDDYIDATPYDDDGNWYVKRELDEEMKCLPYWAVFITAHARLNLLRTAYTVGPENVLYGDTDSLTIKKGFGHLVDQGDEYGQWKLEKEWKEFRAIAPKVYAGVLKDGTRMGAAKGLPRKGITDKHWQELLENGESSATALSLASLRVAMREGLKEAVELRRKSSTINNSSNFVALPNGDVRLKSAS